MKKLHTLIICISTLLGASFVFAESKPQANPELKDRYQMMVERLQLDEAQAKALKPVFEKLKQERADTLARLEANEQKELGKILSPQQTRQAQRMLQMSHREQKPERNRPERPNKKDNYKDLYPKPPKFIEK